MKKTLIPALAATILLSGCASNGLVFTDRTTFGATIKIDPTKNDFFINVGGDFNSFAYVPVFDKEGKVILIKSTDPKGEELLEAASVFASFRADTNADSPSSAGISIGRIFATGKAAVISADKFSSATYALAEAKKAESATVLAKELNKKTQ
jgi:hypothetical protein